MLHSFTFRKTAQGRKMLVTSLLVMLMAAWFAPVCARSAEERADERQYKIESAILYNFFNYITWPGYDAPEDLLKPNLCVYGNDPILKYLDYVRQKMAYERALNIRRLTESAELKGCQMVYIRDATPVQAAKLLAAEGVLTVSNRPDFIEEGGMIELIESGGRIVFEINSTELSKAGFQASSRLLALARKVE